ncbi:hypothetical protein J2S75_001471 [Ancylobacter polymorphus]|uniref:Phage tail tape measure protein n=1 Tax=Ancylobacter polymorphus TaxID=223390 RepID=A0ABU0B9E3_9HYPH|nr:hypothetical protein [Ancylobacter polymorphus]
MLALIAAGLAVLPGMRILATLAAGFARLLTIIGEVAGIVSGTAVLALIAAGLAVLPGMRILATLAAGFARLVAIIGKVAGTAAVLLVRHGEISFLDFAPR